MVNVTNINGNTISVDSDNSLHFKSDANNTRVSMLKNGNLGIGTTNPGEKLQINGNIRIGSSTNDTTIDDTTTRIKTGTQLVIHANISGQNVNSTNLLLRAGGTNYGEIKLGGGTDNGDKTITFRNSGSSSEAMRIHYNGNLGIGTTNPGEKLEVNGNIAMGQQINQNGVIIDAANSSTYKINTTLSSNYSGYFALGQMELSHQQCKFGLIDNNDIKRAIIIPHHTGVIFHWGSFSSQSDDRLKSYETDVFNATDTILKLESKFYKKHPGLITDDPQPDLSNVYHYNEYGFIAQKLLEDPVLSHFVSNNDMDDTYHVNYIEMIPLIVQTIKELEIRIRTLEEVDRQQQTDKARISELETQLASVLTRLNALENS